MAETIFENRCSPEGYAHDDCADETKMVYVLLLSKTAYI